METGGRARRGPDRRGARRRDAPGTRPAGRDRGRGTEPVPAARRSAARPVARGQVPRRDQRRSGAPGSHTPRSFTAYRAALDREFPGTVSALSHDPSGPLTRTWEMSLDLLEAKGAAVARPLFRLISFFAPDPLPVQLLIGSVLARASVFAGLSATGLEEAVRGLLGCGLLHRRRIEADGATVDTLVVHPLVQEITRMQPDAVAGRARVHDPVRRPAGKGWPVGCRATTRRPGRCGVCSRRTARTRRPTPPTRPERSG
ncbi:hypothetical protein LT493_30375 [Streptomyces tricolor]|nr:hypothetical protein [Streptomyces tricolor]